MNVALASLGLFFAVFYSTPPSGPATTPNAKYPVHVHIFIAKATGGNGSYRGFGRGDILGSSPQGFDYTFSCGEPFLNNLQAAEFYQARWKKPSQSLEILMQPAGSTHTQRCELKVALKSRPYGTYAATPAVHP